MRPRPKNMTRQYNLTRMTQLLTMRETLDGVTPADVSRWCGVPEPEAAAALERERMFRMRRA